jgi:hypothetical protein
MGGPRLCWGASCWTAPDTREYSAASTAETRRSPLPAMPLATTSCRTLLRDLFAVAALRSWRGCGGVFTKPEGPAWPDLLQDKGLAARRPAGACASISAGPFPR